MAKISLTVDGRKYRGTYRHDPSSLPELRIAGKTYRGSSLGPPNYMCDPDKSDRDYWRTLVRDAKDVIRSAEARVGG